MGASLNSMQRFGDDQVQAIGWFQGIMQLQVLVNTISRGCGFCIDLAMLAIAACASLRSTSKGICCAHRQCACVREWQCACVRA
eukprot:5675053-Pleurochrysis_carterae.AAC.2